MKIVGYEYEAGSDQCLAKYYCQNCERQFEEIKKIKIKNCKLEIPEHYECPLCGFNEKENEPIQHITTCGEYLYDPHMPSGFYNTYYKGTTWFFNYKLSGYQEIK